jgi:Na+/phosphate symporter
LPRLSRKEQCEVVGFTDYVQSLAQAGKGDEAMMTMLIPIVFILAGVVLYFATTNVKLQEIGRLLFAAGSFALAFSLAGKTLAI